MFRFHIYPVKPYFVPAGAKYKPSINKGSNGKEVVYPHELNLSSTKILEEQHRLSFSKKGVKIAITVG